MTSASYRSGQEHMRDRVVDMLRVQGSNLAVVVSRLPIHGPCELCDEFTNAVNATRVARTRALLAEQVSAETLHMPLRIAAPEQEKT